MPSDALNRLRTKRTPSKHEERGSDIQELLEEMQQKKDFSNFYSYQIEAVLETGRLLMTENGERKSSKPVLIVAPTGAGKSGIITLLPYILRSRKVLVLTPSIAISQQLAKAFGIGNKKDSFFAVTGFTKKDGQTEDDEEEILHNILAPGVLIRDAKDAKKEIESRMQNLVIVNAQKFGGNSNMSLQYENREIVSDVDKFFGRFDTLIVDEAHHYPAPTWNMIVNKFQCPPAGDMKKQIIFFTATPFRYENGVKTDILPDQKLKIAYEVKMIDVVGVTVRKPRFEVQGRKTYMKLFNDIQEILEKNGKLEPRIRKHQAIILVNTQIEAEKLSKKLNRLAKLSGLKNFAVPIVRTTNNASVQSKISAFTNGFHQVAVNCRILTEGYDNTSVSLCVILKRVRSKILFNQFIGRCMRMKKFEHGGLDNSPAVILSYKQYEQDVMWKERNEVSTEDPTDKDEDDQEYESEIDDSVVSEEDEKMDDDVDEA